MGKTRVQTRVEPDTQQQINEYAEERDIGDAEAVRRLIRSGLANEGYPVTAADGGTRTFLEQLAAPRSMMFAGLLMTLSAVLMAATVPLASSSLAAAFVTLVLGTVTMTLAAAVVVAAAVGLSRSRIGDILSQE